MSGMPNFPHFDKSPKRSLWTVHYLESSKNLYITPPITPFISVGQLHEV